MQSLRIVSAFTLIALTGFGLPADAAQGFAVFNDGSGLSKTNLEGLEEQALTTDTRDTFARISPDGSRIVFWRGTTLYTMASDGTAQERLLANVAFRQGRHLCWNADGSKIAFAEGAPGNTKLHTINADGTDHRIISRADDFGQFPWCDWTAHDGEVYISFGQPANAADLEITVCATDGSGCRRITNNPGSRLAELPVLSTDRSTLFFVTREGPFSPPRTLYRADLDASNQEPLTDGTSRVFPVASFDERLYYMDEASPGGRQLFSMAEDGTDQRQESFRPSGMPASTHIVVGGPSQDVTFDDFTAPLTDRWLISQGRQSGPGFGLCTLKDRLQRNIFCGDLVTSQPSLGKVVLHGIVTDGVRYGSEIASREPLPAEGTFAANVRPFGPAEGFRSHASVKAFFTFRNIARTPYRMEHDFEIITGSSRLYEHNGWATREELEELPSPRLTTVTHADGGVSVQPSGLASLGALGSDVYTFVVTVQCIFHCNVDAPRIYEATYHVVTPDGSVLTLGTTETEHTDTISELRALFNVWWLQPVAACSDPGDRRGPPTPNYLPDDAATQYLEIDWFLHSPSILEPLAAHQMGEDLDGGN